MIIKIKYVRVEIDFTMIETQYAYLYQIVQSEHGSKFKHVCFEKIVWQDLKHRTKGFLHHILQASYWATHFPFFCLLLSLFLYLFIFILWTKKRYAFIDPAYLNLLLMMWGTLGTLRLLDHDTTFLQSVQLESCNSWTYKCDQQNK